jgi:predicted nucleotidyltransferase
MNQVKIQTKNELLHVLSENRGAIKSYGVNSLGIFGSFSKVTNTEESDVDLLVDFDPNRKSFDNFMDLNFFLEDLFGRKVEMVTPQSLSKFIGPHILNEVQHVSL